jgi:hypothetical protein
MLIFMHEECIYLYHCDIFIIGKIYIHLQDQHLSITLTYLLMKRITIYFQKSILIPVKDVL